MNSNEILEYLTMVKEAIDANELLRNGMLSNYNNRGFNWFVDEISILDYHNYTRKKPQTTTHMGYEDMVPGIEFFDGRNVCQVECYNQEMVGLSDFGGVGTYTYEELAEGYKHRTPQDHTWREFKKEVEG